MEILVIDGLGGGIGRSIIETIKKEVPDCKVIGIGTNTIASTNMKKGGADNVATGENAVIYNAKKASIIVGPIGIVFANSMLGEISPSIASAISESEATKYLIPMNQCSAKILGVENKNIQEYINELIKELK
jgi:prephenate dehydrogenase